MTNQIDKNKIDNYDSINEEKNKSSLKEKQDLLSKEPGLALRVWKKMIYEDNHQLLESYEQNESIEITNDAIKLNQ